MMSDDDFAARRPAPPPTHVLGQDLTALSVAELEARIVLLRDEIERLAAAAEAKRGGLAAADALFKRS